MNILLEGYSGSMNCSDNPNKDYLFVCQNVFIITFANDRVRLILIKIIPLTS